MWWTVFFFGAGFAAGGGAGGGVEAIFCTWSFSAAICFCCASEAWRSDAIVFWSCCRSASPSVASATVAAAAASVRGYCWTIFASDRRALSFRPAAISLRACFSSAAACTSFGTVRTR